MIAEKVWVELDSRDIRDVIKVARLVTNQEHISHIIGIMTRYSKANDTLIANPLLVLSLLSLLTSK